MTMLRRLPALLASVLDRLADPFAFATRVYVGWQFFKSGLLKIGSWESTLGLFHDEYQVPLLPPALAAVAGTAGELVFPVLLVLGLFGRIGAVGLPVACRWVSACTPRPGKLPWKRIKLRADHHPRRPRCTASRRSDFIG